MNRQWLGRPRWRIVPHTNHGGRVMSEEPLPKPDPDEDDDIPVPRPSPDEPTPAEEPEPVGVPRREPRDA